MTNHSIALIMCDGSILLDIHNSSKNILTLKPQYQCLNDFFFSLKRSVSVPCWLHGVVALAN